MAGEWKKDVVATRGMMGSAGIALALASWFMGRMKMASTDARQAYVLIIRIDDARALITR